MLSARYFDFILMSSVIFEQPQLNTKYIYMPNYTNL